MTLLIVVLLLSSILLRAFIRATLPFQSRSLVWGVLKYAKNDIKPYFLRYFTKTVDVLTL